MQITLFSKFCVLDLFKIIISPVIFFLPKKLILFLLEVFI